MSVKYATQLVHCKDLTSKVPASHIQTGDVCVFVLQSLALAHANIDNDFVFLDKW